MASLNWLFLAALVTGAFSSNSSAMYQQPPPAPRCENGTACLHAFSRSYVNNLVFCCPNGAGMSVNSINNFVYCECTSGGNFFSSSNNFIMNGQQVNPSEIQPMMDDMRYNMHHQMQQFHVNMQNQMARFRQEMARMSQRLNNMFSGWW